jgi:hypothetical protein
MLTWWGQTLCAGIFRHSRLRPSAGVPKRYRFRYLCTVVCCRLHLYPTPHSSVHPLVVMMHTDMDMDMPLPLELVLNIITCSLPSSPDVLLNAAHPTTKLLLAFTLVCHETRRLAVRYLAQHCVRLDSPTRMRSFLPTILHTPPLCNITSMTLNDYVGGGTMLVSELLSRNCTTLKKLVFDTLPSCDLYDQDWTGHAMLRDALLKLTFRIPTQTKIYDGGAGPS